MRVFTYIHRVGVNFLNAILRLAHNKWNCKGIDCGLQFVNSTQYFQLTYEKEFLRRQKRNFYIILKDDAM